MSDTALQDFLDELVVTDCQIQNDEQAFKKYMRSQIKAIRIRKKALDAARDALLEKALDGIRNLQTAAYAWVFNRKTERTCLVRKADSARLLDAIRNGDDETATKLTLFARWPSDAERQLDLGFEPLDLGDCSENGAQGDGELDDAGEKADEASSSETGESDAVGEDGGLIYACEPLPEDGDDYELHVFAMGGIRRMLSDEWQTAREIADKASISNIKRVGVYLRENADKLFTTYTVEYGHPDAISGPKVVMYRLIPMSIDDEFLQANIMGALAYGEPLTVGEIMRKVNCSDEQLTKRLLDRVVRSDFALTSWDEERNQLTYRHFPGGMLR